MPGGPHHAADRVVGDSGLASTEGTVPAVTSTDDERSVSIDYGSDTRRIIVPATIRIQHTHDARPNQTGRQGLRADATT